MEKKKSVEYTGSTPAFLAAHHAACMHVIGSKERFKYVLLAYEVIWLSMAIEDGAGRNEANPQQARECTR